MKTYQDLLDVGANERNRMDFCIQAINEHLNSDKFLEAEENQMYFDGMNPTITKADKFITDVYGRKVPDIWHANHKIKCQLYPFFIIQQVLFLLGNGISFNDPETLEKLGEKFEYKIVKAAIDCLNGGVSFGFWNFDHLEKFSITEFVPLYDEETGRLSAGIRFWRMDSSKPLRITLFESDGYTEYIKRQSEEIQTLTEKRAYVQVVSTSSTGTEIAPGEVYGGLPIIPCETHNGKSAMYGHKDSIDGYDLVASRLLNNIDNFEFSYWIVKGAPALADDPEALNELYQRMTVSKFLAVGEGQDVDEHRVEIPFEASDRALEFLRKQLFADFMAFDPVNVSGGADTATQIKAAYEPLNEKTDLFEYQLTDFIEGILKLAGIEDTPSYTRSMIVNKQEEIQSALLLAPYVTEDYITQKGLEILGDADKVQDILEGRDREDYSRFTANEGVTVE